MQTTPDADADPGLTMDPVQFWHWWAFGGLLVIVEAFAPGFMSLWLGIAAGLVGLVLVIWPELSFANQLLAFAGFSILSVIGWRRFQQMLPATTDHPHLNRRGAQYGGRRFSLVTPIVNGRGRIKLGDSSWTVEGPDLPAGQVVEVTGVRGALLQVRPVAESPEHARRDRAAPEPATKEPVDEDAQATRA